MFLEEKWFLLVLPDKLNIITWFMPFRCVLFIPMEMYLGRLSMNQIIFNLCLQVLWLLGLLLLERFVWYRAQKKIVVQGG